MASPYLSEDVAGEHAVCAPYSAEFNSVYFGVAAAQFPFFEADILLDDALCYVHQPTYERQQAWLRRSPRPSLCSAHRSHVTTGHRPRRAIVKQTSRLWKDGVVPYQLDNNLRTYYVVRQYTSAKQGINSCVRPSAVCPSSLCLHLLLGQAAAVVRCRCRRFSSHQPGSLSPLRNNI